MAEIYDYYRNTKDRDQDEHEAELIERMDDQKEPLDYDDFVRDVPGFEEFATILGAMTPDLPVKDDWSVGFYSSTYGEFPCRLFSHTECDFIFLQAVHAKFLYEMHSAGVPPERWKRATGFGPGQIEDPRP